MTSSALVRSHLEDPAAAGRALGAEVLARFDGKSPDAVIAFVSPRYEAAPLLAALQAACGTAALVGCSSAGEFLNTDHGDGGACAIALWSDEMAFSVGIARGIGAGRGAVAAAVVETFRGVGGSEYPYRSALILTDALAGHADELIEQLTLHTKGNYQFFGGGAGDDANFRRTQVFCGREVASDAVVALEILSNKPIGIGVRHGWSAVGGALRVTEAAGTRIVSLNAGSPLDAFADHAAETGQRFDPADPMPFFLHNVLGIETADGYKLRVPLAVLEDGSVACAAEVPAGSVVRIMQTNASSAAAAAASAASDAVEKLGDHEPAVAIFFDCVATRLRLGQDFGIELESVRDALGQATFAGCNTYGQVARAEGQFSGFHNCTAVVCVLPK